MNLGKVDISHVIGAVIVANLSTSPVKTFDLDCFAILNGLGKGDYIRN